MLLETKEYMGPIINGQSRHEYVKLPAMDWP